MGQRLDRFRSTVTGKVLFIGFLVLLLLIPLGMPKGLIAERNRLGSAAQADISNSWGGAQTLGGPIPVIPCRYRRYYSHGVTDIVTDEIYVLPRELAIEGGVATQVLRRGLHEVPVYTASLSVTDLMRPATLSAEEYEELEILWSEAQLALPLSDARSIREPVRNTIGGMAVEFQPGGARVPGLGSQLVAPLAAFGGTGTLRFLPFGDSTRVNVTSDWPSPSFTGAFLPASRSVQGSGFSAAWQVPHLGRGYPSVWKRSDVTGHQTPARPRAVMPALSAPAFIADVPGQASAFGVDFALLSGALALFGILAAFMYLTRNVDWHSVTFDWSV